MSEELLLEWTLAPWAPTCVNPTEAESSVDIGLFVGYVHVYLFISRISNVYKRFYVITYRNPVFHNCELIYGYGRTLDDALKMARRKWDNDYQAALYALGRTDSEFKNMFCAACEASPNQWVECMYCQDPFEDIERNKDEIVKTLDDLSPTIQDLKRIGVQVT